ncbi:MAG: sugar phosphate isomerase/epimerase family protein [Bryobacterales bacterium]|nr:sugar phosphate isomerase/epimerase family protein [Bryobacterales bacterium]
MSLRLPIAAITDEFAADLDKTLDSMQSLGMTGAELRMVYGKNVMLLTDDEVKEFAKACKDRGLEVIGLATPILKCVLPDGPPLDERFHQDIFGSKNTIDDQPRLMDRAVEVAHLSGAKIIRVFSYWRTMRPAETYTRVVDALGTLADRAQKEGLVIGLENEHACNVATGEEAAAVLGMISHPHLKLVWDPANAVCTGGIGYPDGYAALPKDRIAHVHAKDCTVGEGFKYDWGPLGSKDTDWKGQIEDLIRDGYKGYISIETHWPGPGGDKYQASMIVGGNLRDLVSA